jgi:4-diphosphocytidyl-2-C-methyl-D-erythritol kinase
MDTLTAQAPAKINLTLRVGPRRADGYHPLESLVALLGLADTITVSPRADGQLVLRCDDPTLPTDERNLALRAARALATVRDRHLTQSPATAPPPRSALRAGGEQLGAEITLEKRIPAGAGLGGGSSDAATTLGLLNSLWHCGLSTDELAALGATLGSDVPLFFHGPLCLMRGRGEVITRVPPPLVEGLRTAWVVLVLPALSCSTAAVYAEFDRLPPPTPAARPAAEPATTADQPGEREAYSAATSAALFDALVPELFNDLEPAAFRVCPQLAALFERARGVLGPHVRMTGSGAGLYHLYAGAAQAQAAAARAHGHLTARIEVVPVRA